MRRSENFDLNLYEGTDIFNPLTNDVPNYEKIDAQMKKNYNLSVGKATELKTGTVHALTRENADCPMIHFTATSNFTSNDTFTVDGVQVSALLVDGSTLPTNCYIIGSEVICYLKGTLLTFFLSGSISKDSEKLGGELPSYYSKQQDFEQLETTVNSMSGIVEKNSNDITEMNANITYINNNFYKLFIQSIKTLDCNYTSASSGTNTSEYDQILYLESAFSSNSGFCRIQVFDESGANLKDIAEVSAGANIGVSQTTSKVFVPKGYKYKVDLEYTTSAKLHYMRI